VSALGDNTVSQGNVCCDYKVAFVRQLNDAIISLIGPLRSFNTREQVGSWQSNEPVCHEGNGHRQPL
jgi:hypothetical protein